MRHQGFFDQARPELGMVDIVVTLLRWFGCTMLVIMFALAVAAAPRRCRAMAA